MKVLVTGGTGVIGEGVIPELLKAGHRVRLLTRGAEEAARQWPDGVEPFTADVSDPVSLRGAAKGCDAVVHITGIVEESPPEITFERINVEGTRNVMKEAERARALRFIFISSLGAERGASDYHRSKHRAEEIVRGCKRDWLILRPGNVYGPGDEVISTLLKMVRALPAVPIIDDGEQRFQPIWYRDMGAAVAQAVDRPDLSHETLELAGSELTTMRDLVERLGRLTGRNPALVTVPSSVATLATRLADMSPLTDQVMDALGLDFPMNEAKLTMLLEENFIRKPVSNALVSAFKIKPLPLDRGLKILADATPEQLPSEGFGGLQRKRFRADIVGSPYSPAQLIDAFRFNCDEVMPIEFSAEPGAPRVVERDATLTASLPVRGHIQMRVAEVSDRSVTFVTIEGHPLAGIVRFMAEPHGRRGVRFTVELHARAANALDFLAMRTLGDVMQNSNWEQVVERVVEMSGGRAPAGVQQETTTLDEEDAERIEREVKELVETRKRANNARAGTTKTTVSRSTKRTRKPVAQKSGAKKVATKAGSKKSGAKSSKTATASKRPAPTASRKTGRTRRASDDAVSDAINTIASVTTSAVDAVASATKTVSRRIRRR